MRRCSRKKPKVQLARTIRYRMEKKLLLNDGLVIRQLVKLSDGNSVALVGLGLMLTMLIGFGFYALKPWLEGHWYFQSLIPLNDSSTLPIAAAAFLGGGVSILSRLRDFSKLRDVDPVFLFLDALLKPVLGIILGVSVYAFIK